MFRAIPLKRRDPDRRFSARILAAGLPEVDRVAFGIG